MQHLGRIITSRHSWKNRNSIISSSFTLCFSAMDSKLAAFILLQVLLFSHFATIHPFSNATMRGEWQFLQESIGISAMHMQLLHDNNVVIFDRTDFGKSNLSLPAGRCRIDGRDTALTTDCTAHSVLYDSATNGFRPLMVQTDTWCSSGAVIPNGTLIQTGGFNDGDHIVRSFSPCQDGNCDWNEFPGGLSKRRWYASNQILPDGKIIIVGGRRQFNYEFYNPHSGSFRLDFLRETMDDSENNLYPFLHLLPDGNLFIFANTRSILFDYKRNGVIREFPPIPGNDSRNYPSSGSSVLLPINENNITIEAEIMVCGGSRPDAFRRAKQGVFRRASRSCGRLKVTDENPTWKMETMPVPRVMGDMLILPNGELLIINGASLGSAGWESAKLPVKKPLIYNPNGLENRRFSIMKAAKRPRLYHSSAILLADGRVLVGGSNPHIYYNFTSEEFPTDLSLEAFSPPYLASMYEPVRPKIAKIDRAHIHYQKPFSLTFRVAKFFTMAHLSLRIAAPPFTTHSFSMSQRMVVLKGVEVTMVDSETYNVTAIGPSSPEIAPQGYYLLFVANGVIPSSGIWVNICNG